MEKIERRWKPVTELSDFHLTLLQFSQGFQREKLHKNNTFEVPSNFIQGPEVCNATAEKSHIDMLNGNCGREMEWKTDQIHERKIEGGMAEAILKRNIKKGNKPFKNTRYLPRYVIGLRLQHSKFILSQFKGPAQ